MVCDKATPGFYCSRTPGHDGPCAAHLAPTNSAVAARHSFDGYGFQYIDNGSGSDWQTRHHEAEFLYPEETIVEALTLMKEFCARVDAGEIRSRKTYAKFKIFIANVEVGNHTKVLPVSREELADKYSADALAPCPGHSDGRHIRDWDGSCMGKDCNFKFNS